MTPLQADDVPALPPRAADGHKGDYGRVLIVAGSRGMGGAAILAAAAALRGGAGLVRVAVPESLAAAVTIAQPCAMTLPLPERDGHLAAAASAELMRAAEWATVLACGPGLGTADETKTLLERLVRKVQIPLVLDADALNVLGSRPSVLRERPGPTVLTPHAGEFGRLRGSTAPTDAERPGWAGQFAAEFGIILVLKGAATLVTDGRRLYRNQTGNPGMATGGTGDVLTGVLAALLAQKLDPFDAARLAVYAHGAAGDLARDRLGEVAVIASDLLDTLPAALRPRGERPA